MKPKPIIELVAPNVDLKEIKGEENKQNPFRDTECCGAVRGTSTIPPSSMLPIATLTTCRKGSTTTALDAASKEEEEEIEKDQFPFQNVEDCEVVRGTTPASSTSVPSIASTARIISSAFDVVIEQQEETEKNLPFQEEVCRGVVHGTSTLLPSSAPPIASSSTRQTDTTSSDSDVASKQQEEEVKQIPFQENECCREVRGATSIPTTSAPPIASTTSRRTGAVSAVLDVASDHQKEEEQLPFQENECCEADLGSTALSSTSVLTFAATTIRRTDSTLAVSELVFDQQEEVKQSPFSDMEYCGEVRGTSALPPSSAPPIASSTTRRAGSATSALDVVLEQQEAKEDQFPFRDTESCGEVRGSAAVPTAFAPPIATTSSRRTGSIFSALDAPPEQEAEEVLPFQDTEYCGAVRGTTSIPPSSAPPIATTATRRTGTTTSALDVVLEQQKKTSFFIVI